MINKQTNKTQNLKAARQNKLLIYKGNHIGLAEDFSIASLQARREWHDIFKLLNGENM